MRLLHTKNLRVQQFVPNDVPKYAILSHTWGKEEVTLQDIEAPTFTAMKGFSKLQGCCERADKDGYQWVWVDTCCIDKTSSAELSEAINSMYSWYQHSAVCYAYLSDIQDIKALNTSRWFSRGWTLQELIAPRHIILFDGQWRNIGTKQTLIEEIMSITGISKNILLGSSPLDCNVAQRMSWAANRQTTRDEDMAYCLVGLFDVHMPPIYGEGSEKAFLRLQEEILKRSSDQTLFLWTPSHEPYNQGLLATSPGSFCTHYDCFQWLRKLQSLTSEPMPRKGFKPYSFLHPFSVTPPRRIYDETTSTSSPEGRDDLSLPASLGSRGLQIALLLDDIDLSQLSDEEIPTRRTRLVSLDVFAVQSNIRATIALALEPDEQAIGVRGFIINRLGNMRRRVYTERFATPTLSLQLNFKRENVTISQIDNCGPGQPANFMVQDTKIRNLARSAMIFEPEGSPNVRHDLTKAFKCKGGVIMVKHSCPKSEGEKTYALVFGTRGRLSRPWLAFEATSTSEISDPRHKDTYQRLELLNTRWSEHPTYDMRCDHSLMADIDFTVDKDIYCIKLATINKKGGFC